MRAQNVITVALVGVLGACSSAPIKDPWHPTDAGCFSESIHETLAWADEAPLSAVSFRLAVTPDTGQGPATLVVLDSGKLVNLGHAEPSPHFLAAVGSSERTCVIRMAWEQCPALPGVYETLKRQALPLGFEFERPADILVFHAPTYYLTYSDGQGNQNNWRFYGLRHPLQAVIDDAFEALKPCWEDAERRFGEM